MTAIVKNICIEQGTDWSQDFVVETPDSLIGSTAAMQIRTRNGATFIATLTTENGGLLINEPTNTITAKIAHEKTAVFVPECYVYDIKVTDAAGNIFRSFQGAANVSGEVTVIDPLSPIGIPVTGNGDTLTGNGETVTT